MSRYSKVGVAIAATVALAAVPKRVAANSSARASGTSVWSRCSTATSYVNALRSYVVDLVTAQGSDADQMRTTLHLPVAAASDVAVVADSTECGQVYAAHLSMFYAGDSTKVGSLAIVKVGTTRYVVNDIHQRAGEFGTIDVYDVNGLGYLAGATW